MIRGNKLYINITNHCDVCCPFCCMKSDGKKYAGEIWATSWEEAECFIKQRASTEKAVGFIPKD